MRIAYAWLLLIITLSNWVGGFLYIEIREYIEVRHEMNATELTIAAKVQETLGTKSAVKVLKQQPHLKGDVYGDAAFAADVQGETVYYTLLEASKIIDYEVLHQTTQPPASDADHSLLLKSLFQEFELIKSDFSVASTLTPSTLGFYFNSFFPQCTHTILTPPPNFA